MFTLIKDHRYLLQSGSETRILRVEELVSGSAVWEGKFRLQIPASARTEAKTIHGTSAHEVAELGAEFLSRRLDS